MTAAATILTPTGCIGNRGIDRRLLQNAIIAERPDAIAVDAGSADCGPWYLGAGKEHSPRRNIEWDLEAILSEAVPRGIRVIIGSAGGSGARPHVRNAEDAIRRIARRIGLKFRLASIYADVEQRYLLDRAAGAVVRDARRVPDGAPLTADDVRSTEVIVGMMGTGPIIAALEDGAEVVLAGRAVDAAVIASYPIWRDCAPGLAYHMGDIMECAESCAVEIEPSLRTMGRNRIPIIGRIDEGGFSIRPAAKTLACTPESCLMHSAYERTDLFSIKVPEGTIDRSHSRYESEGKNGTRISGTSFVPEPLSILFEGVRRAGFRSIFPFAVRTPRMIAQLDDILAEAAMIEQELFGKDGKFEIHWHQYGRRAALGPAEPDTQANEVGVLADVIAETQELAHDVAYDLLTRIGFWRYPGRYTTAGNIAVTLSPAVIDVGPAYVFSIYHAMPVPDWREIFRLERASIG